MAPFGLVSSPACLIKILNMVISGNRQARYLYLYMDDALCGGVTWLHHLKIIGDMLQKFAANNLSCNPTKCVLGYTELTFLGHSVSKRGIRIAKEKFPIITKMAPPKNRKSLQRLSGLTNYFRKFIRNFASRTANMRRLLRADQPFIWSDACQTELEDIKDCLLSDPLLIPLQPSKRIVVMVDASDQGYGFAILQTGDDGKLHPCYFGGSALTPSEEKHTPAHKELGALVQALKSIEHLASLSEICVFTDSSSVLYYKTWVPQTARLKRIICYLQQFSLEIRHIPGCKNLTADCLSRVYEDMTFEDRVQMRRQPDKEEFLVTADYGPQEQIRDPPEQETLVKRPSVPAATSERAPATDAAEAPVTAEADIRRPNNSDGGGETPETDESVGSGGQADQFELTDLWLDGDKEDQAEHDEEATHEDWTQMIEAADRIYQETQVGFTEQDYLDDDEFGPMYKYLKDGTLTGDDRTDRTTIMASELFFLRAPLLFKVKLPKGRRDQPLTADRLCVPKKARAEILLRFHDVSVHIGIVKTFLTIASRFYWKDLYSDVHVYVRTCDTCQKSRRNFAHKVAPLHPLQVPQRPFTHLSIDFKNLTRRTKEGYTAILVVVCQFSFYPYLIPTKTMTAREGTSVDRACDLRRRPAVSDQ